MTAFRKYFNLILIILGGAILFSGKSSVGAWLMLSAAGTVVFVFSGVVFLRERNFFERHLTCDELAKFQQLFPLINPLGIRIANSKYDAMEKERNERLKQISAKRADFFINSEAMLSQLLWTFMIFFILIVSSAVKSING
jgi:hypothetical protein